MTYIARPRWFTLNFSEPNLRNNLTLWYLGDSSGSVGYAFPEAGIMTKLTVCGETLGAPVAAGTLTVNLYKGGTAAGDIVYSFSHTTTIGVVESFGAADTTAGAATADFGTGSDWFLRFAYTSVSSSLQVNAVIEGYFLA